MEVNIHSTLIVQQLTLVVHLGWSEAEREQTQQIWVDIEFDFLQLPKACDSDELADTICYYKLSLALQAVCSAKSYKLLELLAHDLFKTVKNHLTIQANVTLSVAKKPPMDNLQQARFVVSDKA